MLSLKHQTVDELVARLRVRYEQALGEDAARIADCISTLLASGDITEAHVGKAWGLTAAKAKKFRSDVDTLAAQRKAIKGAKGR